MSAERERPGICLRLSIQSPGGQTVQKEHSSGKRGGCSVRCALCLLAMLLSSLHQGAPAIHCRWASCLCPWPPGPCCSAFVSLLSLCGNQRKHTVQCSLPVLEPLTRVVVHDTSLIWVLYIPCDLCLGSFQRFSPPGNVVLNFCHEGNRDWPTEIEPKPFYHWLQWKPV